MQVTRSSTRKKPFPNPTFSYWIPQSRKAILQIAFRMFPVFLAFLLSALCITFLFNIQPAGAFSAKNNPPSKRQDIVPEYLHITTPMEESQLSPVFTKEVLYWEEKIIEWAKIYQLDPNLVAVVMQIESCGHPSIQSGSGANGLFQVMPFHFSPDENPNQPDINARRGLTYLARSLTLADGNPALALAGYNGGHSVIQLDPERWAKETQRYVYWGSGILADISSGNTQSSRLIEWLNAGGESLCIQSAEALGL
jgi:hypothetical protein